MGQIACSNTGTNIAHAVATVIQHGSQCTCILSCTARARTLSVCVCACFVRVGMRVCQSVMPGAHARALAPRQQGRGALSSSGEAAAMAPKRGGHGGPPGPDGPQQPRAVQRNADTAPFWVAAMAGRLDTVGAAFDEQSAAVQVVYGDFGGWRTRGALPGHTAPM